MQNATSRFLQADNECDLIINMIGDTIGSLKTRLGYKRVGANTLNGASSAMYDGGTYLFAHAGTKVQYNNNATDPVSGTWTTLTGGTDPTASMVLNFQRYKDIKDLYIVGATASPSAASDFLVTQVVADEVGTPGTKADADTTIFPRAKYVTRWRDRLYFGYCYATWVVEGALIKPERVVYTDVPATGSLGGQTINDAAFTNFLDLDDPITGMAPTLDYLIVWTRYAMWKYDASSFKKYFQIGCVNHKTIQQIDIYTFWWANEGLFVESGGKPELISGKVQPIVEAVGSNIANIFSWVDGRKYKTWLGTIILGTTSLQNAVLVYNVDMNGFYLETFTLPISSGSTQHTITAADVFDDGTNTRSYFIGSNNKSYIHSNRFDATPIFTDGTDTDEDFAIPYLMRTKRYDDGAPEERTLINHVTVFSELQNGCTVKTRVSNDEFQDPWVHEYDLKSDIQLLSINMKGYDMQFEFSGTGKGAGAQIHGIAYNPILDTNLHP